MLQRRPRALLLSAILLLLIPSAGCGASVRAAAAEAPRAAMPGVIDESLKAGEDAPTRERIVRILATPEMKQAIAEVAKAAVAAAFEEATSEESEKHIAELTNVVTRALVDSIAHDIAPALVADTRDSLRENLSPSDMKALEGALGSLAAASTSAAMRAAAKELPTTLGPAIRESLARELRDPELHEALAGLVADATRQMVRSSEKAVADAQADNKAAGRPGPIERLRSMLISFSWVLALAFGGASVVIVALMLRMRKRTRRYRAALLALVANQTKAGEHGEKKDEPQPVQRLLELLQ